MPETRFRKFRARLPGVCHICKHPILPGQICVQPLGEPIRHEHCLKNRQGAWLRPTPEGIVQQVFASDYYYRGSEEGAKTKASAIRCKHGMLRLDGASDMCAYCDEEDCPFEAPRFSRSELK